MPKFKLTDNTTGKSYMLTAPDQASALAAFAQFTAPPPAQAVLASAAPGNGGTSNPNDPQFQGLALPGQQQPVGAPPVNTVPPSQHFGLNSGDTLNPLPALASAGEGMASSIPIAGPYLQNWRDKINSDVYGGTPQQARADIENTVAQNPEANVAGKVIGNTAPYLGAAEVPLLKSALGLSGPWFQRLAATVGSQYAINTGDNLAHGQDLNTAAKNGAIASVASAPFALLGKGKAPEGAQADAVAVMRKEGIPLTAGQQKGSKALMTAESQLGGAATTALQDRQLSALTTAALKRAGVAANSASPPVLRAAYDKIGSLFDRLASRTAVKVDGQLQNDLLKTATDYQDLVGQPAPIVEKFINRVGTLSAQNGGILQGDNYKVLITDLREAASSSGSNEVRTALTQMRTAIDDAVERSMGPRTRDAWQVLRQQYKNLIHVTDAVAGAGEKAAKGLITPASLRQAISAGDKRNYAKGYGDLNELSHAANITMTPIPDSGTAGRLASIAGVSAFPAAAAALSAGNPGHAAAVMGGLALPSLAGRALLSGPGRAFMGRGGSTIPAAVARGAIPKLTPAVLQILGISP